MNVAGLWQRWVTLLGRREDATALAVCRIVVGATVAGSLARVWWYGVADAAWVEPRHGGMRPLEACWLGAVGGCSPGAIHALLAIGIGAAILMTAGVFTRASVVATWLVFRYLTRQNALFRDGSDALLINILFLLMLSGCGNALSIDARLRGKAGDAPAWPRWLLMVQLVIVYLMTGVQKVSYGWVPGGPLDAIWYVLQQPTWQRRSMHWVAPYYVVTQCITLVTWLFEVGAPVLGLALYYRGTSDRPGKVRAAFNRLHVRSAFLAVGVVLHVGISVALQIEQFLGGMMALYACCFSPEEWQAAGRRAMDVLQRRGVSSPAGDRVV